MSGPPGHPSPLATWLIYIVLQLLTDKCKMKKSITETRDNFYRKLYNMLGSDIIWILANRHFSKTRSLDERKTSSMWFIWQLVSFDEFLNNSNLFLHTLEKISGSLISFSFIHSWSRSKITFLMPKKLLSREKIPQIWSKLNKIEIADPIEFDHVWPKCFDERWPNWS